MKLIKGFLINLQFLTALPIKANLPMDQEYLEKSIRTFPLLGLFQGVLYSMLLYSLLEWTPFSPLAVVFIVWLFMIISSGGIHLDGWMDASDAFFSYQDKDKRVEIMKDPRTGAFGVLAVIILLSLRFLFIYEITMFASFQSFLLIMLIPFLSKGIMGVVLLTILPAKKDGLASFFRKAGKQGTLKVYPVYLIVLLGIITIFDADSVLLAIALTVSAFGCYLFIRRKAEKWFGGITGDVLGATVEGTETFLWMILWLLHYFVMG
ncbi:adenosylcobinamide-GDP ribazoletransferase [Virgibacillus profundi]|uniref:Adenosylcobinamide-GDP ribazoletransferase n=1 Tax=Virgibacillus profundi TaxID=2024555 RepID=A0A2A2I8L8_9BACI|nr:adenosylcobinamide-GDP ribazoletransferase [Virgibacillus profundi]PAV27987.1 adenosylcobinamide-GDP ribazoletransferase [Virgibacillus profundi]PXY52165.1 adenosylcobinamide-GDP ribazoletransferase [Virgibacillus profundi]